MCVCLRGVKLVLLLVVLKKRFFFFKGNYSECNKNMFSALKGLIYLLCHEKINAINTSTLLLYGER